MADRDLTLRLRMENSQAKAADREFVAAHRKNTKEIVEMDATAAALHRELFGETHNQLQAFSAKSAAAQKELHLRSVMGANASAAATALWTVGLQKAFEVARLMGDAVNRAGEKSRELAARFSGQRESLGELADLMGRPADNQFTLDIAKYNAATGFTPEEGRKSLTALYNAGAQYKGRNISDKEFDEYAIQQGKLALVLKMGEEQVGDVAGSMLGFTNFQEKFGDQASEQALAMTHRALKIMQSGQGAGPVMARQFKMLAAGALSEDKLKGMFTDPDDVAITASIGAEKHDALSAELGLIAGRALRDPRPAAQAFFKEMGIDKTTKFLDAWEIMGPKVVEMARKRGGGTTTRDIFTEKGFSVAEVEAMSVFANKADLIAVRRAEGAKYKGTGPSLAANAEYDASERGMLRRRTAETVLAETEEGAENSKLQILRQEAMTNLIKRREINRGSLLNAAGDALPFSAVGTREQAQIDEESQRILRMRGGTGGGWADYLNVTPLAREQDLNRQIDELKARGINPLTGEKDPANAEMLKIEKERRRDEKNAPGPAMSARPTDRFIYLPR